MARRSSITANACREADGAACAGAKGRARRTCVATYVAVVVSEINFEVRSGVENVREKATAKFGLVGRAELRVSWLDQVAVGELIDELV